MPHPTQLSLLKDSFRCAYARTSIPISQYVEQAPQDMHMSFFTRIQNLPFLPTSPSSAAMGQKKRHQTREPSVG